MKTKLFLVAILAGMLSLTSAKASVRTIESAKIEMAQMEIKSVLQQMFNAIPLEDYIESEETVQIYFTVNQNNEITNVKTYSNNFELANYVYHILTTNKVVLVNATPDNYSINLVFDIK